MKLWLLKFEKLDACIRLLFANSVTYIYTLSESKAWYMACIINCGCLMLFLVMHNLGHLRCSYNTVINL